jgi:hypothetical protein
MSSAVVAAIRSASRSELAKGQDFRATLNPRRGRLAVLLVRQFRLMDGMTATVKQSSKNFLAMDAGLRLEP